MICDLRVFLEDELKAGDEIWMQNYKAMVEFQDTDGSFNLFDTFKVESDVQVKYTDSRHKLHTISNIKGNKP